MRRIPLAISLAALLTVGMIHTALAAKPVHDRFTIDETFTEELCGIEVTTHLMVDGHVTIFSDGRVMDLSRVLIRWTNADGAWLENFVRGQVRITEVLDGDILTITSRNTGVHERLRSSEGITAAFDRGQITFVNVIDLNDLENPDDDVFVSSEVVSQHGPHPEADSGFTLFCEVATDVLG